LAADNPPERYRVAAESVGQLVRNELAQRRIPCLSVTVVDDRGPLWSAGFGFGDVIRSRPATGATLYRVGPASQLLTTLAILRLVEQGKLDLNTPASALLPGVLPAGAEARAVTLRHLMNHRAGLCREAPDDLHALKATRLAFAPGTQTKSSLAGAAVAARLAADAAGVAWADLLLHQVIRPADLKDTRFEPADRTSADAASGWMWTPGGRESVAIPTRPNNLLTSSDDLGRLLTALLAGRLLDANSLKLMCTPEVQQPGTEGIGVGVRVTRHDGQRQFAWDATGDGVSVEWLGLPDAKVGVVVIAGRENVTASTGWLARQAARQLVAARDGRPLPSPSFREIVAGIDAGLTGVFAVGDDSRPAVRISQVGPRTWAWAFVGGRPYEVVRTRDGLHVEFAANVMPGFKPDGPDKIRIGQTVYKRLRDSGAPPEHERWAGLIGEYVSGPRRAAVFEDAGRLYAQVENIYAYPLVEGGPNSFHFPNYGLFAGEPITFDGEGREVRIGGVRYRRDPLLRTDGAAFRIAPRRPVADLLKDALAATPPAVKGELARPDLVDLATLDPAIRLDIRYAGANNFLGVPVYPTARAFLQRPAAEALLRAHRSLAADGLGLLIHDAYRPWHVTKVFWDATPPEQHNFVADPAQGSRHNRGCAVDLTLYELTTGRAVEMPGGYDEFSDRSYPEYAGGTSRQRWYRDRLRRAMAGQGFSVYEAEWWHFDYQDWKKYPVLNIPFERVGQP
jgi:D-alanyl-D-alanine dipeptidase/CubicO group peptidase (beta-lactamase class C family)